MQQVSNTCAIWVVSAMWRAAKHAVLGMAFYSNPGNSAELSLGYRDIDHCARFVVPTRALVLVNISAHEPPWESGDVYFYPVSCCSFLTMQQRSFRVR